MSELRLKKLFDIETELLPLINESDLDDKTEAVLKGLSKLVHVEGMEKTNAVILETVLFLNELKQEGEHFLQYEKKSSF